MQTSRVWLSKQDCGFHICRDRKEQIALSVLYRQIVHDIRTIQIDAKAVISRSAPEENSIVDDQGTNGCENQKQF